MPADRSCAGCGMLLGIVRAAARGWMLWIVRAARCDVVGARIQRLDESFTNSRCDFFEWEVSSYEYWLGIILFTLCYVQKTIPDADAIPWDRRELKGITRGESCRDVRIALEYWLCMIREFMRAWYTIVQVEPEWSQGTPCCTKVTRLT